MSDKTILKFTRLSPPYNAGEIAGFNPDDAAHLILRGLATWEGGAEPEYPPPVGTKVESARAFEVAPPVPGEEPPAPPLVSADATLLGSRLPPFLDEVSSSDTVSDPAREPTQEEIEAAIDAAVQGNKSK